MTFAILEYQQPIIARHPACTLLHVTCSLRCWQMPISLKGPHAHGAELQ